MKSLLSANFFSFYRKNLDDIKSLDLISRQPNFIRFLIIFYLLIT